MGSKAYVNREVTSVPCHSYTWLRVRNQRGQDYVAQHQCIVKAPINVVIGKGMKVFSL